MLPPIEYKVKTDVEPIDDRIEHKSPFCNGNNGNHRGDLASRILLHRSQVQTSLNGQNSENEQKQRQNKKCLSDGVTKRSKSRVPNSISETGAVSENPIKWKQDRSLRTSLTSSEKHPNLSSKTSPKLRSKSIGTRNVAAHGETRGGNPMKEEHILANQPEKTDSKSKSEKYPNALRWPAFQRFTDERILRWLEKKDEKMKEESRRKKHEQKAGRILAQEIKMQQQHRVQRAGAAYEAWLSNKSSKPKSNPGDLSQPKSTSDCTLNQATPVACEDPPRCKSTTTEFPIPNVTSLRLTHKQWVKRKFIQARNAEQARWQAEERVFREKECNSTFLNYWRDVLRMHRHRPELNSGTTDRKALGEILKQLNCCTLVVGAQLPEIQRKQPKRQTRRLTLRFPATLLMPESCTEEDIQEANHKLSIDHTVIVVDMCQQPNEQTILADSVVGRAQDWTGTRIKTL
ncbi:hypothetical protein CRM22_008249 [Opisthorchis felineus]|uniref:Uncharacterized protein n=1 Tax=Opisthorchis felineus TaxID=147828 RepID=A0A4S2LJY8_OPIFE|nr:hypothetical protein CRM22_008249 [Opisthorchis felineus]